MVFWGTAHTGPQPQVALDGARQWQAADKIVYSRTLTQPRSARMRIEREFDPEEVRRLKANVRHDITLYGPELAAHALRAGLVDELQMIVCPVVGGAGKRFFPGIKRLAEGDHECIAVASIALGAAVATMFVRRHRQ